MQEFKENNLGVRQTKGLKSILFKQDEFTIKCVVDEKDRISAFKLRHAVFSKELRWVPENKNLLEMDCYDRNAVTVGVFDGKQNIIAMLRILESAETFMLEKEFPFLIGSEHHVRKEKDTVEISRLCVAPKVRNIRFDDNFGVHAISMLLYKGVYHWCLKKKVRYLYLVVEQRVYRLLCEKGFPCKPAGPPVLMPDGVEAVAAILDWREFEESNVTKRAQLLEWFTQCRSNRPIKLQPRRVSCLPHQAFS